MLHHHQVHQTRRIHQHSAGLLNWNVRLSTSIQDIPARLLIRRPDLRAAAWQVAAQSAQIGIAEADYYPAISLLGAIGWSGSSLSGSPTVGNLGVGPALSWNIFDYGRIENNVRVQDARLQQLIEKYQETALQAAREVDDAAISVLKTAEQQAILDESVSAARRALEIANTRYREGYSDFQRVLDAQRSLFEATLLHLRSRQRYALAHAELERLVGQPLNPIVNSGDAVQGERQ